MFCESYLKKYRERMAVDYLMSWLVCEGGFHPHLIYNTESSHCKMHRIQIYFIIHINQYIVKWLILVLWVLVYIWKIDGFFKKKKKTAHLDVRTMSLASSTPGHNWLCYLPHSLWLEKNTISSTKGGNIGKKDSGAIAPQTNSYWAICLAVCKLCSEGPPLPIPQSLAQVPWQYLLLQAEQL